MRVEDQISHENAECHDRLRLRAMPQDERPMFWTGSRPAGDSAYCKPASVSAAETATHAGTARERAASAPPSTTPDATAIAMTAMLMNTTGTMTMRGRAR